MHIDWGRSAKLFLRRQRPASLSDYFVRRVADYLPLKLDFHFSEWGSSPRISAEETALVTLKAHAQWTAKVLLEGRSQVVTLDPGDIIGVPVMYNPPHSQAHTHSLSLAYVVAPQSQLYPHARTEYGARGTAGIIMLGPLPDFQLREQEFHAPLEEAFWHS